MADNQRRSSPSSGAREPLSEDERARMRQLADEGHSVRAIASQVGRSRAAVSRAVKDVANDRREQTAKATQARTVTIAERRAKLLENALQATGAALGRWATVEHGDHRGSSDEAKAFSSLAQGYAKLDERHTRAESGGDMSAVDAWVDYMTGGSA